VVGVSDREGADSDVREGTDSDVREGTDSDVREGAGEGTERSPSGDGPGEATGRPAESAAVRASGDPEEPRSSGAEDSPDPVEDDEGGDGGRFGSDRPVRYLQWAGVAVLAVTALVALFGFYTGVSRTISVWVSESYRPIVNAGFNLALLLAALGGIGLLLRRAD
jgi:hypothetical protein